RWLTQRTLKDIDQALKTAALADPDQKTLESHLREHWQLQRRRSAPPIGPKPIVLILDDYSAYVTRKRTDRRNRFEPIPQPDHVAKAYGIEPPRLSTILKDYCAILN